MAKTDDLSRSLIPFEPNRMLIAVIEMSLSNRFVVSIMPGDERHPSKKLDVDDDALLRWRDEAVKTGGAITRIAVAFEAGRDGFWLGRWLRARGIEGFRHPCDVHRGAPRPPAGLIPTGLTRIS